MKRNDSTLTAFLLCMGVSLVSPNYLYGKGEVAMNIMQQSQKITGKVVDSNGEPIIGATIKIAGTSNGTITDYKLGDSQKAADRINKVRERAALEGHVKDMDIEASDVNIDFILDERAREMAGEYNRWMDLKRTGKLIERTLKYNNLAAKINKMDEHIVVRPIPQSVIDQTTGNYKQNTGY